MSNHDDCNCFTCVAVAMVEAAEKIKSPVEGDHMPDLTNLLVGLAMVCEGRNVPPSIVDAALTTMRGHARERILEVEAHPDETMH